MFSNVLHFPTQKNVVKGFGNLFSYYLWQPFFLLPLATFHFFAQLSFLVWLIRLLLLVTWYFFYFCLQGDASESDNIDNDSQFCIQHMIRKLAFDPYIGHRVMLLVSQRISVLAEKLLFSDPFDDAFPNMHSCMFLL